MVRRKDVIEPTAFSTYVKNVRASSCRFQRRHGVNDTGEIEPLTPCKRTT